MQGKLKHKPQLDMFKIQLKELISKGHALTILGQRIDWDTLEKDFEKYYSTEGRPSVPTRTMAGLLMLKSMFNESDEMLIPRWLENPYWQHFCGEQFFRHDAPCDPSDLVHFRKRIKKEGYEYILKVSAGLHGKEIEEETITIDSTAQEKDITFPTDAKLAVAIPFFVGACKLVMLFVKHFSYNDLKPTSLHYFNRGVQFLLVKIFCCGPDFQYVNSVTFFKSYVIYEEAK